MERQTKTLHTQHGHEVVIKEYATGGEYEDIQACYLSAAKLDFVEGQKPRIGEYNMGHAEQLTTRKTIETLVVSVDGVTENVVDAVRNLRREDYEEVIVALNEATGKKTQAASSPA